jgi:Flp pilus assembly protein CpaB
MTFRLQLACAVIGVGLFAVWLHRACQPDVPIYSGPIHRDGQTSKNVTQKTSIPPGMVIFSVQVDKIVSGFVTPGVRVDVLLTNAESQTVTVLENVEVIALGSGPALVADLLVSPDDAQKLKLASFQGKIGLSLRNPSPQILPPQIPPPFDPRQNDPMQKPFPNLDAHSPRKPAKS